MKRTPTRIAASWFAILILTLTSLQASDYLIEPIVWKDIEGRPLPFQTLDAVEEYLKTADVVSSESTPEGVTKPRKVLLEKEGVQVYACFRHLRLHRQRMRLQSGKVEFNFRDDAIYEVAAYELAKLLGFRNVPPTVMREIKGQEGSLQIWIPNAVMQKDLEDHVRPAHPWRHSMQNRLMHLFDALIYNDDRHLGNILYDSDWNLWMIDHTRAFRIYDELKEPELVSVCERTIWERLTTVPEQTYYEVLGPYLRKPEIDQLLKRKVKLVKRLGQRMEEKGTRQVLFALWSDSTGGLD